jgi:hypothetical protein
MEGENASYVSGEASFRSVPRVNLNLNNRKVNLNSNPCDNANDNLAVPSFRESSFLKLRLLRGGVYFTP